MFIPNAVEDLWLPLAVRFTLPQPSERAKVKAPTTSRGAV